jgi:hypothetical protein
MGKAAWHTLASPKEQKGALADRGAHTGSRSTCGSPLKLIAGPIKRSPHDATMQQYNDAPERRNLTGPLQDANSKHQRPGLLIPESSRRRAAMIDGNSPERRRGGGTDDDERDSYYTLIRCTTLYYVLLVRTTFPPFESPNGPRV